MKTNNRELRDWFIITVIILIGFLCLIVAGSMAVRFSPSWELNASMDSLLDPNSDFLTRRPLGFFEPVDETTVCEHEAETGRVFERYALMARYAGGGI